MYPLLFCSILTLAIIIDRIIFWVRLANGRSPELIDSLCRDPRLIQKPADAEQIKRDIIGRVLMAGIENNHTQSDWEIQLMAKSELDQVIKYQMVLKIMVSLSPLLGIFGTVLGIIDSFSLLGDKALTDPVAASGGLAEALITTAFGLAIAMLSLIAFTVFQSRAEKIGDEMNMRCTTLAKTLLPPQKGE